MNLICGINPVLEALAAGTRHFDRLLVVKGLRSRRISDAIRRATHLGIPLRFEMRETLDRMAGGVPHQGLIAVVSEKPVLSLEEPPGDGRTTPALLVVLDGVEDPRNLGAILRTAEAAGADGVLLPERHSAGLSETVARASAGALEHVQGRAGRQPRAGARGAQGARRLGGRLRRRGHRAVGRGRPRPPGGPRARRRGARHPAPGARALRPPRLDPALRPRRLAQRLGGRRHRALRGRAPASRGAEHRAPHSRAPRGVPADHRPRAGRPGDRSRRPADFRRRTISTATAEETRRPRR